MNRFLLPCLAVLVLFLGAAANQRHLISPIFGWEEQDERPFPGSRENDQRLVFLLQYIASDYDRAVKNERIIDSLEYHEMQRFAQTAMTIYRAGVAPKAQTLEKLSELARLIADKASPPQIRAICKELVAACIKEKNLIVLPRVTPDLARGEELFRENCVSCHGNRGAGDGPSADTLNPKPRDFTDSVRFKICAPYQLFQAITFGVEGTAMPAFAEAFTTEEVWDIAFYLMTLRCDFQPLTSDTSRPFTLQQLATQNNTELAAILLRQNRFVRKALSPTPDQMVDYFRKNPPQPTIDEYLAITEKLLKQSLAAYVRGDSAAANQFSYEAYWQSFEMIERKLQPPLYCRFERIYGDYNSCIETPEQVEKANTLMKMMIEILHHIRKGRGLRS
jgi:high-affinity iron transporter